MTRARGRIFVSGVHERHHIIPKSIGGSNSKNNIVYLTFREHFLAHWLLIKFTEKEDKKKMQYAFFMLTRANKHQSGRTVTSWQYERSNQAHVEAMRGNKFSLGIPNTAEYKHTEEWKIEKSLSMKGNKNALGWRATEEQRAQNSARNMGNKNARGNKGKRMGSLNHMSKKVLCVDTGKIYGSMNEAARELNVRVSNIRRCCRNIHERTEGYQFRYVED
jgi:hypothetical protein